MRAASLQARRRRRFAVTTDSAHTLPLADNVVARQFAVGGPVNTVWVSDTAFIPTGEGWLYLAVVIDLASRFVVGWATSARNDTGECQGSCRMSRHAAVRTCASRSSFVGLSRTVVTGVQLRVGPRQREGCFARAAS